MVDLVLGKVPVGDDLPGLGSSWKYMQLTCIHTIAMKANGFKSMASSLQNEVDVADVLNEPRMLKTPICQTLIDVIFRTEKPNNTLTIDVLITIDTLRALILGNRATHGN